MRGVKCLIWILALALVGQAAAAGKASHVVLIVWDGMRPDFVSPSNTPTLFGQARNGVTFAHHHPVYVSSTEVNGTALATGMYPGQSTITANDEFRPEIDPLGPIEMQDIKNVRKGDQLWNDHYIAYPTVAEILRAHGLSTVVAGSKAVAVLHDRAARTDGARGVTLFAGNTLPPDLKNTLVAALGKFPRARTTAIERDQWTTRALTDVLWKEGVPAFSLLWLAEPDYSQHLDGPGAPNPLKAIKNADDALAQVLKTLEEKKALDSTDVIILSDHGFSTVTEVIDVAATLRKLGLRVFHKFPAAEPANGDIMLVSDGGLVLIYVTGHDDREVEQAVHCLQAQPYTGVLLTRKAVAGTFPLSALRMDSPYSADIVVVMRWMPSKSKYGVPGLIYCDRAYDIPNKGSHATLCPTEMHNTCVAFGPDFARGMTDSLPTGNIDIAPTILWILGVPQKQPMSGRVLSEALTIPGPAAAAAQSRREEASWKGDGFVWRQYLDISEVNGVTYFDQGNGSQETPGEPKASSRN
jgi:arylsulfatase A-like enzyme